jgi:hypothetical protein
VLVEEPVVEDADVDVCALAVDSAGYASSIAMKAIVDVVTIAVFANLVVIFKVRVPFRIFTGIPKSFPNR